MTNQTWRHCKHFGVIFFFSAQYTGGKKVNGYTITLTVMFIMQHSIKDSSEGA